MKARSTERRVSDRWIAAAAVAVLAACGRDGAASEERAAEEPTPATTTDFRFTGSAACEPCHEEVTAAWSASHHALAEREIDPAIDRSAFLGKGEIRHGSLTSTVGAEGDELRIVTEGSDGEVRPFAVDRVIGVSPLRQFLVGGERGRRQVAALSYDPAADEWFDVFGEEDRRPHEWGHWANRGMTWNAMCADCHNTNVHKGYDAETDSYETTFSEMGVGCEACHGPGRDHVAWQEDNEGMAGDPTLAGLRLDDSAERWVDACGACHSRRLELREEFLAGEPFLDSFYPDLPDLSEVYYADGQVHEEDYEYVSFLLSRMHAKGVVCTSCHDPHSARPRGRGNDLCLMCHAYQLSPELGPIDPASHSHHDVRQEGGQCVGCHMPVTTYMQRHPRRDHGLLIPDPLLTKELGIPNACNRCHDDQTVDWAIEAVEEWYGERMERPYRTRARIVARARTGDRGAGSALAIFVGGEPYDAWRAVGVTLLGSWGPVPEAWKALVEASTDEAPLVRAAAARAMATAGPAAREILIGLLDDPVRAVRFWAASSLGPMLDPSTRAARDLAEVHRMTADQPSGLVAQAGFWLSRGDLDRAITLLRQAVDWDPGSAGLQQTLAVALSQAGLFEEAIKVCKKACELAPDDPDAWFSLGLARGAIGNSARAAEALERATDLDPAFVRAWYNLGLARNEAGDAPGAVHALENCTALEPNVPDHWFALAAVLRDAERVEEAKSAARKALVIDPRHAGARGLLEELEGAPTDR